MGINYIIVAVIVLALIIAYNFVDDVRLSANQWVDTTLNGETYCPSGSIENVQWAVQFNGIGIEHTKTKDGKFCFQTKDKAQADKIIKDAQDREIELQKTKVQEKGKTDRMFILLFLVMVLVIAIIWFFSRSSGYSL